MAHGMWFPPPRACRKTVRSRRLRAPSPCAPRALGLDAMRREISLYAAWYNHHRPHQALNDMTPAEMVDRRRRPGRPRKVEPRPCWPVEHKTRRLKRLQLVITLLEPRRYVPIVERKRAAQTLSRLRVPLQPSQHCPPTARTGRQLRSQPHGAAEHRSLSEPIPNPSRVSRLASACATRPNSPGPVPPSTISGYLLPSGARYPCTRILCLFGRRFPVLPPWRKRLTS